VGNTVIPVFLLSARERENMPEEENVLAVHNGEKRLSPRLEAAFSS